MGLVWTPLGVPGVVAAILAVAMAGTVLFVAPGRFVNRTLALLLFVEGVTAAGGFGFIYFADTAREVFAWQVLNAVGLMAVLPTYLLFLSTQDSPLTRPLRSRLARVLLVGLLALLEFVLATNRQMFVVGVQETGYARLDGIVGPWYFVVLQAVWATLLFGLAVAYTMYRRTQPGTPSRRRARSFLLAFGVRDVLFFLLIGLGLFAGDSLAADPPLRAFHLQLLSVPTILFVLFMGHGILTTHLFDIDLKIKWTVKQSTVAAAFVAVFLVATEGAQVLLGDENPWFGIGAAALLVFALAPLQRAADRVANAAMPGVADTEEYRTVRKREVYRAAVESAMQDGRITDRERDVLATLQEQLGIAATDAVKIEREVTGVSAEVG